MELVTVHRARPHVSLVTLCRPQRLNPLDFAMVEALYRALDRVAADNDCWVAVLTGAGRGFCSGLDLEDEGRAPGLDGLTTPFRAGIKAMAYMSNLVPAIRSVPQPIVAAVNGPAYGGGMCIALACDIRVAARSATFCAASIRNGLTGTELGASYLLPRTVGVAHAFEILLTGRSVTAEEAERIGLVSRVVDDDAVVDTALDLAEEITRLSPYGVWLTKQVLWSNLEAPSLRAAIDLEDRNQLLAAHTGNLDEARAAFRERRRPVYRE